MASSRPILVTIIAVITLIVAIVLLLGGIGCIVGSDDLADWILDNSDVVDATVDELSSMINVLGAVLIIVGIVELFLATGMFKGWTWVWYLAVILYIVDLILTIIALVGMWAAIIPLIIDILILHYLFRPGVKQFFGV